jgi:hypothetical protein
VRDRAQADGGWRQRVKVGTVLDPEFVSGLRRENKRALVENGYVELMPVSLELVKG